MSNQGYANLENDVLTPQEEKISGCVPEGPTTNQAVLSHPVLPPMNIAPGGHQIQPPTNQVLMSQPPYPSQPMVANVPPRSTYTVAPTSVEPINTNQNYATGSRPAWAHNSAMGLSITLIVSGLIMFIMNIIGLTTGVKFAVSGAGFWGGALMVITGGIGVCASKRKSNCTIISLMVLAIILAVLSACIFGAHTAGTIVASVDDIEYMDEYDHYHFHDYESQDRHAGQPLRIAFNAIMTIFALVVFLVSIIASALSCRAVCCRSNSNMMQVVYVPATGSCHVAPLAQGQFVPHGGNLQFASYPPHGQLQSQYVQNQGTVVGQSQNMTAAFSPHTRANDYNPVHTQRADEQNTNAAGCESSPPPAYQVS
ncbi:unnamed protein product [Owenia fusiformis]|uniref:Uncharacterized protein n=1 Tax=Owenia fusiformis TaxID=6347 RepID=A0A8S4N424_OWEFU|nr:unnamed protein product [Owenia fusiformis]